ncbi:MAG: shikimate dehydrogenase [Clostridia bacterium]|nr:shikimate dehydrogenase [Clostridia bacterium]
MKYGLIGERLGHSFSPELHSRLFGYEYELCELKKDELDAFMKKKDFKAINVTIPYKEAVIPYLDELSERAKKIGAVNTVINKDGRLYGDNTDFLGLLALINRVCPDVKGKKVLVLGTGGTSKTARAVCEHLGASFIYTVSRTKKDGCITYEDAKNLHNDAEVIINATPVGMFPNIGVSPIDLSVFPSLICVVDAIYNPLRTELLLSARRRGISSEGGLYMLVYQGAFAGEKFIDKRLADDKADEVFKSLFKEKENIVLVGMPSSGKSTVGKILSAETGKAFIDTDEEIVKRTGKEISDIFKEKGESYFRLLESEIIKELSLKEGAVIATGGGAILNERNIELLKENGRVYFLDRPLDLLITTSDRPLSSNSADLTKRYNERYSLYCERCDKRIDASGTPEENARIIKEDFYDENTCN